MMCLRFVLLLDLKYARASEEIMNLSLNRYEFDTIL